MGGGGGVGYRIGSHGRSMYGRLCHQPWVEEVDDDLPLPMTRLKRIHFRHLEDRVTGKLCPWEGKQATMVGCSVLVKVVLTRVVGMQN